MSTSDDHRPDRGNVIIAAAIVASAFILSWGLSGDEPRYQLASSGDGVVRMDSDSGEMIACNARACSKIAPPTRARSFGPLTIEVGEDAERKAPPRPESAAP